MSDKLVKPVTEAQLKKLVSFQKKELIDAKLTKEEMGKWTTEKASAEITKVYEKMPATENQQIFAKEIHDTVMKVRGAAKDKDGNPREAKVWDKIKDMPEKFGSYKEAKEYIESGKWYCKERKINVHSVLSKNKKAKEVAPDIDTPTPTM